MSMCNYNPDDFEDNYDNEWSKDGSYDGYDDYYDDCDDYDARWGGEDGSHWNNHNEDRIVYFHFCNFS